MKGNMVIFDSSESVSFYSHFGFTVTGWLITPLSQFMIYLFHLLSPAQEITNIVTKALFS